jgi:DNA-directed RNA polymerase omega subunit
MNDYDKAARAIGNRFDLVLVASERMREIHRERRENHEDWSESLEQRKLQPIPSSRAISDIEQGQVNRDYLNKIKDRNPKSRPRFDALKE